MTVNETEKSIRIPVVLYADGKPLDVSGLIAIPNDRLKCFEELALQIHRVRPHFEAYFASPHDHHTSDKLIMELRQVMPKLNLLLALWDIPPSDSGA
jgi:hypothetical protein